VSSGNVPGAVQSSNLLSAKRNPTSRQYISGSAPSGAAAAGVSHLTESNDVSRLLSFIAGSNDYANRLGTSATGRFCPSVVDSG
jgi:hypothetical protein